MKSAVNDVESDGKCDDETGEERGGAAHHWHVESGPEHVRPPQQSESVSQSPPAMHGPQVPSSPQ
jgi:hypothetical protein